MSRRNNSSNDDNRNRTALTREEKRELDAAKHKARLDAARNQSAPKNLGTRTTSRTTGTRVTTTPTSNRAETNATSRTAQTRKTVTTTRTGTRVTSTPTNTSRSGTRVTPTANSKPKPVPPPPRDGVVVPTPRRHSTVPESDSSTTNSTNTAIAFFTPPKNVRFETEPTLLKSTGPDKPKQEIKNHVSTNPDSLTNIIKTALGREAERYNDSNTPIIEILELMKNNSIIDKKQLQEMKKPLEVESFTETLELQNVDPEREVEDGRYFIKHRMWELREREVRTALNVFGILSPEEAKKVNLSTADDFVNVINNLRAKTLEFINDDKIKQIVEELEEIATKNLTPEMQKEFLETLNVIESPTGLTFVTILVERAHQAMIERDNEKEARQELLRKEKPIPKPTPSSPNKPSAETGHNGHSRY